MVIFASFVFRSLKTTRKQKLIIEDKQKEILDSIRYAKRIQTALMSNEKYIENNLNRLNQGAGWWPEVPTPDNDQTIVITS